MEDDRNGVADNQPSRWAEDSKAVTPHNPGAFTPPKIAKRNYKGLKIAVAAVAVLLAATAVAIPVALYVKGNDENKKLTVAKEEYMGSCLSSATIMMNNTTISRDANAKSYCDCVWSTLVATIGKPAMIEGLHNITAAHSAEAIGACTPLLEL
jgi:hypothetical protein